MLVRSTYMNILRNKTNLCSHYKTNYWFITKKRELLFIKLSDAKLPIDMARDAAPFDVRFIPVMVYLSARLSLWYYRSKECRQRAMQ